MTDTELHAKIQSKFPDCDQILISSMSSYGKYACPYQYTVFIGFGGLTEDDILIDRLKSYSDILGAIEKVKRA